MFINIYINIYIYIYICILFFGDVQNQFLPADCGGWSEIGSDDPVCAGAPEQQQANNLWQPCKKKNKTLVPKKGLPSAGSYKAQKVPKPKVPKPRFPTLASKGYKVQVCASPQNCPQIPRWRFGCQVQVPTSFQGSHGRFPQSSKVAKVTRYRFPQRSRIKVPKWRLPNAQVKVKYRFLQNPKANRAKVFVQVSTRPRKFPSKGSQVPM